MLSPSFLLRRDRPPRPRIASEASKCQSLGRRLLDRDQSRILLRSRSLYRATKRQVVQPTLFTHDQTRPTTGNSAPVTARACSLARNKITAARSSGETQVVKSALGMSARLVGVSMTEGSTALTVMLSPFNSSASACVRL